MPTLLQYLSTADPDLDRSNVKTGTNTFNSEWDTLEGIEEWDDFTYENLIAMLGDVLERPYQSRELETPAQIRRLTRRIIDEPTVTSVLLKWNHTIVDCALSLAAEESAVPSVSWALGSHASLSGGVAFPDWAGIDTTSFPASNRVPGDSKVSGKWSTDQQHSEQKMVRDEFDKPLRQVVHYAKLFNTRYAYVISDRELVCIRRKVSEYEGDPIALNRPLRLGQAPTTPSREPDQLPQEPTTSSPRIDSSPPFRVVIPHRRQEQRTEPFLTPQRSIRPRQTSIASTVSSFSQMSLDSPSVRLYSPDNVRSSPSAYTDGNNPDVNEGRIQIAVIPWAESEPNCLTVNLALFWLHILAGFDVDLQSSYPPLGKELALTYGLCTEARRD